MDSIPRKIKKYHSSTNGEHKYGIGKHFLKEKKVYLEDKLSTKWETPPLMVEYLEKCQAEGLEIRKLEFGQFEAKNGFKYEGFRATEDIGASDILIKVPKKLVLTTKVCLFSDIQVIVRENLKFFTALKGGLVEDHIMLVFLLRQYQLGRASPWFLLVSNLSRYIDTVDFWEEEEYKLLDDQVFRERIRLQRNYFNYIYKNLKEILPKYPQLFDEATYTEENVRWIYIHIWSRCFGGVMDYVSMVPIVEMMNHENTNMFFRIHKHDAPIEKVEITKEERECHTSTENDSYLSEDTILANEGDFEDYENLKKLAEAKMIVIDVTNPKLRDVSRHCLELEQMVLNDLNLGDHVSIFFASKLLEKVKKIQNSVIQAKKKNNNSIEEISRLKQLCTFFISLLKSYDKTTLADNVVINSSQKKIFEKDVKLAQEAVKRNTQQSKGKDEENDGASKKNESGDVLDEEKKNNSAQESTGVEAKDEKGDQIQQKEEEVVAVDAPARNRKEDDSNTTCQTQNKEENKECAVEKQEILENQEQNVAETSAEQQQQTVETAITDSKEKEDNTKPADSSENSQSASTQQDNKTSENTKQSNQTLMYNDEEVVEQKLNDLELQYTENAAEWKEMQYDDFILMADEADYFEKGSQVYFCYNRLSNRNMLSKYGMALELNKYEYVTLRLNYINEILTHAPYSLSYVKYFELNQFKRFVVTYTRFNTKIVSYAKAMLWDLETQSAEAIFSPTISLKLELKGMQKVEMIYQDYLNSRLFKLEENEAMLEDRNQSGHAYFASVYRTEKMRVITHQLNLVRICIHALENMIEQNQMGQEFFKEATVFDKKEGDSEFYHRNRYVLRKYIGLFPKENKQF